MTDSSVFSEVLPVTIEKEMRSSYLDYAMSVIVSRALPDVRDGLKPVHRRILYAMAESGCDYNKPYRKSARIVGEVMGKYHPHGDQAIYDALVRMAQDFSLRLPLIDGQGNFGSMDGDAAAAMRYTESRLAKASHSLLDDIDKNTIDFQENYDGSEQEPKVLPARFPNLVVNGTSGIAVGMATNIPPHNLGEIVDATCALLDNPDLSPEDLIDFVPGPDFPTGGIILGRLGSRLGVTTGRGSVIIRGKAEIEELSGGKQAIIVTEIPYQVNKAKLVERIAELVKEKKIEGISDLRDESDRKGVRVVIEVKRDAIADVVLSQIYTFTPLQTSFGMNMLALDHGRPKLMNLKDVLTAFIAFREEVVTRRTIFLLGKARERAHVLIGLSMAVANIDEVISIIRSSKDPVEAKDRLLARDWHAEDVSSLIALVDDQGNIIKDGRCFFTEAQVRAILDMRLQRLTGLEKEKITQELSELAIEIKDYLDILSSHARLTGIIRHELLEVREEFATPRRTVIVESEFEHDIEDLIQREEMVVTVTMNGYIKRTPLSTYRAQKRGGKGRSGMNMRSEDLTTEVFVANTHMPVLFFSSLGKVYRLKVYRLPLGTPQSMGRALVNIFPLAEGETITNVLALPENEADWAELNLMFATSVGNIRRSDMSDFKLVQSNGKIAIRLDEKEKLVGVRCCYERDHVLLATRDGKSVRFPVSKLRVIKSRSSNGVRGMILAKADEVISISILHGAEAEMMVREGFLKLPVEQRQAIRFDLPDAEANLDVSGAEISKDVAISMAKAEEILLTVTENGYGKRTSAYEYRITNRGGKGILNIVTSARNGKVVASFPVEQQDQIMLMTSSGKLIRCPVKDIRIIGRNSQGVIIFRLADGEKVVTAVRIEGNGEEGNQDMDDVQLATPSQDAEPGLDYSPSDEEESDVEVEDGSEEE